ncbi:hypothetical protein [Streptomyces massasporeus]|uniref:hypothetical protein n=1 Tax=Streptomyces massasporeus TaxID=67324 RepID=UPI00340D214C
MAGTEFLWGLVGELADVAADVPGVARLAPVLGSRPIKVEHPYDPPSRHIEVQLAASPDTIHSKSLAPSGPL